MARIVRSSIVAATIVAVLTLTSIAQASSIRSSAERHQRPGHGFFQKHTSGTPIVRMFRRSR